MTIEEALISYMLAQPEVTSFIGRRLHFDSLPMGTKLPACVIKCVSDVKIHTHQGQSKSEAPVYQLTVFGRTRAEAAAAADEIKAALCDYVGDMFGIAVEYITLLNELPDTITNNDGTVRVHVVDLEFEINYKEG